MYITSAKAWLLAAIGLAFGGGNIHNFAMHSGVYVLDSPRTSTSRTRRIRNTVAAAKRAAIKAKRRKAHKARCR